MHRCVLSRSEREKERERERERERGRGVLLRLTQAGVWAGEGGIGVWVESHLAPLAVDPLSVVLALVTHSPTHHPGGSVELRVQVALGGVTIAVAGCERGGCDWNVACEYKHLIRSFFWKTQYSY